MGSNPATAKRSALKGKKELWNMSNYEPEVPSPQRWEMSRRRLLRNLGVAAVAVPFAGALTEALTDMPADASPRERFLAGKRGREQLRLPERVRHAPVVQVYVRQPRDDEHVLHGDDLRAPGRRQHSGHPDPAVDGFGELDRCPDGHGLQHGRRRQRGRHRHHPDRPGRLQHPGQQRPGQRYTGRRLQRRRGRQQQDVLRRAEQPHRRCRGSGEDRGQRAGQER